MSAGKGPLRATSVRRASLWTALLGAISVAGCAEVFQGTPPAPDPLLTVTDSTPGSEEGRSADRRRSFELRCASPAVVRCVSFDSKEQVTDLSWWAVGQSEGRGAMGRYKNREHYLLPEQDCEEAVNGCSLKFTIPTRSGAGASGAWFANFSDDFSVRFGENEEFYVQWRQRFSKTFLETRYEGGGWKQIVVGEGDRPSYAPDNKVVWSCTQLELVVVNHRMEGFPSMYHSCGEKDGDYEDLAQYDWVDYQPDEWMTFQMSVKIGSWYRNDFYYNQDSEIELWVAREGERSRHAVVDRRYDLANTRPGAKYGKLWLLPYHTGKDASQDHPEAYTWYDEVIISREPIPDP